MEKRVCFTFCQILLIIYDFRTENTPMIVGLGEAAKVYNEGFLNIESILRQNRDYFEELLLVRSSTLDT